MASTPPFPPMSLSCLPHTSSYNLIDECWIFIFIFYFLLADKLKRLNCGRLVLINPPDTEQNSILLGRQLDSRYTGDVDTTIFHFFTVQIYHISTSVLLHQQNLSMSDLEDPGCRNHTFAFVLLICTPN